MSIDDSYKITESICPACNKSVNAAGTLDGEPAAPNPGDFCVCIYCGTMLIFKGDLSLRELNIEYDNPTDEELGELLKTQIMILTFNIERRKKNGE